MQTRQRRKKTPTVSTMAQEATNNLFGQQQFGFQAEDQENDENTMAM